MSAAGADLAFGPLGYGAAGIGNLYREVSDEQAAATVEAAWAGGIRYFDTAPHYGLGLSERRLGAALRGRPRGEFLVSTKAGQLLVRAANPDDARDDEGFDVPADFRRVWDPSESGIRRSLEDSLARLGLDAVDILYLHDPDVHDLEAGITQALRRWRDSARRGSSRPSASARTRARRSRSACGEPIWTS